jgi:hypothetical protein
LIVSDITSLWEVDLEGHRIGTTNGVLTDASMKIYNRVTRGGPFWSAETSINAGAMLRDLRLMKSIKAGEILASWTCKHRQAIGTPEQQAIAYHFPLRKILHHKWNWRGAVRMAEPYWAAESAATCCCRMRNACLVCNESPLGNIDDSSEVSTYPRQVQSWTAQLRWARGIVYSSPRSAALAAHSAARKLAMDAMVG